MFVIYVLNYKKILRAADRLKCTDHKTQCHDRDFSVRDVFWCTCAVLHRNRTRRRRNPFPES